MAGSAVAAGRDAEREAMYEKELNIKTRCRAGATVTTLTLEEQKAWIDAVKDTVWNKFIEIKFLRKT